MTRMARSLLVLTSLMALSGCNSGLVALWSTSSDSGSSTTTVATTVSNVTVSDSKNSPAEIRFTLAGQSVNEVHLEYLPPPAGGSDPTDFVPIVTLGAGDLSISSSGEVNQYSWEFADDLGTGFVGGLVVRVRLNNGSSATTGEPISVGNSPPVISPFSFPATEVVGVVGFLFTVADTDDTVTLSVEVNVDAEHGFPEGSWETALPALGQELVPFVAAESGTTVPFFWDVVGQYGPLDSEVKVRATAVDTADPGEQPLQHQVEGGSLLRVDNNAPPAVSLNVSSFTQSDDRRRGIVVPYTVRDAEGDTLDLVFQWTLEGEAFVDLPDDEALVQEILEDPALREQFRIATPYRMPVAGRARSTGEADTVELTELGSSQSHLLQVAEQPGGDLSGALDGYELELLRSSRIPEPLAATWSANPLDGPVAALPTEELATAYVLDRAGTAWRVREIDLATGVVLATLATGPGEPDTMTMERGGAALLVAAHDFNVRVCRVDLDTLEVRAIFDAPAALPGDTFRGLASVGSEVALATLGDQLLRLNYAVPFATTIVPMLDGLATPWGVTVDPLRTNHVYLAERDFAGVGRVLSLDLDTLAVDTLFTDSPGLPHPETLAIESGKRLLVLTDETPGNGTKELRALQLSSTRVDLLTTELPESAAGLAAGTDDLRLVALGSGDDLAVGGGVVQRRTIVAYDPTRRVATVDAPFAPPMSSEQLWRTQPHARLELEAGVPRSATFVWDSRDLPGGQGEALLRLTARDADASADEHDGGKSILSGLDGEPVSLGGPGTTDSVQSLAAADIDGDGDIDLVSANAGTGAPAMGGTLAVFFQTGAGVFDSVPSLILGGSGTTDGASSVATADLDGDGDLDLVSANTTSSTLTVFFQTGAGVFDTAPSLTLGGPGTTDSAVSVATADLDGDGDADLVSGNRQTGTLTVFFQTGAGVFDPVPLTLSGGVLFGPRSVTTADVDGDGDIDLVSTGNDALAVFFQTGPGVFDLVPSLTLGSAATLFPYSVEAADVDGDGHPDLVSANIITSSLTVFFQTEAGVFDPVPLSLTNPAIQFPEAVEVVDMDGDGDADLVSTNFVGDTLTVFLQTEPGVFDSVPSLILGSAATTNGPIDLVVADLDGDGNADFVTANVFSNTLTVFMQTGAGVFDPLPSLTLGSPQTTGYPGGVTLADLDGDGDADLVSANVGLEPIVSSSLTVFFQTAPGVFDPEPSLILGESGTTDGAVSVAAADLDGDGDVDLVSANGFDKLNGQSDQLVSDTLSIYFQTAPGVFDPTPSLILGGPQTTDGAVSVAAADLDGDGDVDIVSANGFDQNNFGSSNTVTVFFQTMPGVFDPLPSLTLGGPQTTEGANSVKAADLDGDGDLDLVSANATSNAITLFFQNGGGVFDPVPSLTLGGPGTTDGPYDVTAADLDGDGDLDLVSANAFGNTFTVFYQTSAGVFDPVPSLTLNSPGATDSPQSVTVADLDGDGDADLVSADRNSHTLTVFFQRSAGVFESESFSVGVLPTASTELAVNVMAADLDGDGDVDIISANGPVATVTVFYGSHEP